MKLIILFFLLFTLCLSALRKTKIKSTSKDDSVAALLVIDMQNNYLDESLPGYIPNTSDLISKIASIRKKLKSLYSNLIEVYTIDCLMDNSLCINNDKKVRLPDELFTNSIDSTEIPNSSERTKIHPTLGITENFEDILTKIFPNFKTQKRFVLEKANEKAEYSGFGETFSGKNKYGAGKEKSVLNGILSAKNVKKVYVVGLAYQQCVLFTAVDAAFLKYETFMIENGSQPAVILDKPIQDKEAIEREQIVERLKVKAIVKNRKNGLPWKNNEKISIVRFENNDFI